MIPSKIKNFILAITYIFIPISLVISISNVAFSNFHLSALLTEIEKSEDIMNDLKNKVSLNSVEGTGGNCLRIGVVGQKYCGILEWNEVVRNVISNRYLDAKDDLELQDFMIGDSEQFPFGGEFLKPKDAYHQHMKAWIEYTSRQSSCKDYECLWTEYEKPNDVKSTFLISKKTLLDVVPVIDFKSSKKRINEIFAD